MRPLDPILPIQRFEDIEIWEVNTSQSPLIEVQWEQGWPENIFAPNGIAGCTPIAIAQFLSVFEKPNSITYSFPNRDIENETLNWTSLKKHKDFYSCTCSYFVHLSLARLIREIGQRTNSDYRNGETGTNYGNIESTINNLTGLTPDVKGVTTSDLFSALENNTGVAVVGNVGHTFNADAIQHYKYRIIRYIYDIFDNLISSEEISDYDGKYIHYNWGWGGNCNGYFIDGILKPSSTATHYDNPDLNNNTTIDFQDKTPSFLFYKYN